MKSDTRSPSSQQTSSTTSRPLLFRLGAIGATPGAIDLLDRKGMNSALFLDRHQRGDFGTVDDADAEANVDAIAHGSRIVSAYIIGGERLWIITEADRSSTTLLLPEEY